MFCIFGFFKMLDSFFYILNVDLFVNCKLFWLNMNTFQSSIMLIFKTTFFIVISNHANKFNKSDKNMRKICLLNTVETKIIKISYIYIKSTEKNWIMYYLYC